MTESRPGVLPYSEGGRTSIAHSPVLNVMVATKASVGPETPSDLGWPFSIILSSGKGGRLFWSGSTGYWVGATLGEPVSPRGMEIPSAKGSFTSKICPVRVASRSLWLLRVWL